LTDRGQPFARIARRYRLVNRVISLGLDKVWRREAIAALSLKAGERVLDIGSGAGEMLEELPAGVSSFGVDPSGEMLRYASVPFHRIRAVGEELPFRQVSFDAVISAYVLRNLSDRAESFRQIKRILKPGGRGTVIEFSFFEAGLVGFLANLFVRYGIVPIGGILSGDFPAYRYLRRTILSFPKPAGIVAELHEAGLSNIDYRRLPGAAAVLYTFSRND